MDCIDAFINLVNNMETKIDEEQTSFGAKYVSTRSNCTRPR